jgi:hypothetical protein
LILRAWWKYASVRPLVPRPIVEFALGFRRLFAIKAEMAAARAVC